MVQHNDIDHSAAVAAGLSFGSNANSVSAVSAAGASTSVSRADHVHVGVLSLTHTSNTITGGAITLQAEGSIGITRNGSTIAINSVGGSGGAGSSYTHPTPWCIQPDGLAVNLTNRAIGAANRAVYSPVTVVSDCTLEGFSIIVGTQSGNVCVGLYNAAGSRVATSGSVACPATGVQVVNFSSTYAASAGRYYMGFACDNNTATFGWHQQVSSGISSPVQSRFEASAFPLPATITSAGAIAGPPAMVVTIVGGDP